ncbi:MAG: AbrB/MazE/SpoVT family DNA-binding domain-containing protein [Alphaproteobacteria bacterium]|nr:AbrB/MazE/SpoVT family DNA-binding domain-containing protein [Alphaproteobacteria bacterium]
MRAEIVSIGNSKGIRLPKAIMAQCGFEKSIEMNVVDSKLIIQPVPTVRQGWDNAFAAQASADIGHFKDLQNISNAFDDEEWEW